MSDPRPSWDEYGLGLALAASRRADCTRRRVGAVLMGRDRRILALGYNGAPSGVPGCLSASACPRGRFTYEQIPGGLGNSGHAVPCIAIHAERNCLEHFARGREWWEVEDGLAGATLYITDDPCPDCRVLITDHHPLNRVVTPLGTWTPWKII